MKQGGCKITGGPSTRRLSPLFNLRVHTLTHVHKHTHAPPVRQPGHNACWSCAFSKALLLTVKGNLMNKINSRCPQAGHEWRLSLWERHHTSSPGVLSWVAPSGISMMNSGSGAPCSHGHREQRTVCGPRGTHPCLPAGASLPPVLTFVFCGCITNYHKLSSHKTTAIY